MTSPLRRRHSCLCGLDFSFVAAAFRRAFLLRFSVAYALRPPLTPVLPAPAFMRGEERFGAPEKALPDIAL